MYEVPRGAVLGPTLPTTNITWHDMFITFKTVIIDIQEEVNRAPDFFLLGAFFNYKLFLAQISSKFHSNGWGSNIHLAQQ